MPAAAHKGAIAFGLVYIPVQLFRTTRDYDISFNQLCKDTNERVKYKKICPSCNEEVSAKDIVKGYQYEKDKYVIMTDDEIETIKTKKDKTIHIMQFTKLNDIDAKYYEKNYYAIPEPGGEKAYQLFFQALKDEGKVAIEKTVLGTKENLMALCPEKEGLLVKTLFFEDEIVDPPKKMDPVSLKDEEISMATMLIDSMTKPFKPQQYHDEYQSRLREAIANKINGKDIVAPKEEDQNMVMDLMEALQRSLGLSKDETQPTKKSVKKTAKKAEIVDEAEEANEDIKAKAKSPKQTKKATSEKELEQVEEEPKKAKKTMELKETKEEKQVAKTETKESKTKAAKETAKTKQAKQTKKKEAGRSKVAATSNP